MADNYWINRNAEQQHIQDEIVRDKAYKEEVTMDKLRGILIDLSKIGKSQEAKGVLEKYNATKIPQLDKSDYNKVYNELINLKQLS